MPSTSIRLKSGVNTNLSPALNEAGISASNQIRFREGLVEKRGGWTSYLANALPGAVRAVLAFRDAVGNLQLAAAGTGALRVISGGAAMDITPRAITTQAPPAFATTQGSNVVTITDTAYSPGPQDTVEIPLRVSIGGLGILGTFPIASIVDGSHYTITMPSPATLTASGGVLPVFTSNAGSAAVIVNSPASNETVGDTNGISPSVTVGGLTLSGVYPVTAVQNANLYTLTAASAASYGQNVTWNGGNAILQYTANPQKGAVTAAPPIPAQDWSLSAYGSLLIACAKGGSIYTWNPTNPQQTATLVAGAPQGVVGAMVADAQQMIIAYGVGNPKLYNNNVVAWCDAGNPNTWTASGTNQAGSFPLPTGTAIIGAAVGPQGNLIWTDIDLWLMQYVGYPFVWGFDKIATGCGLIAQFSWARVGAAVIWMSQKQFWIFQGGSVQPLPCTVWDLVFPSISPANAWKIRGGANSGFDEAVFFFPSAAGTGENDSYVCYNVVERTWDVGTIARSAWTDQSVLGQPIGGDPSGNIFQHETSPDAAGQPLLSSFTTGWFLVAEGETFSFVDWLRPDIEFPTGAGTVQVSILTAAYTTDAPTVTGPYPITTATEFINTRARGRYVALRFASSDVGSFWRIGRTQMRFSPSGRG